MALPGLTVETAPLTGTTAEVVALAVRSVDGRPAASEDAVALARSLGLHLATGLERARAKGDAGEVVELAVTDPAVPTRRLLLVGVGAGSPLHLRRAGAAAARRAAGAGTLATDLAAGRDEAAVRAVVEGALLAAYRFRAEGAARDPRTAPVGGITVHVGRGSPARGAARAVEQATVAATAAHRARDLANTPSQLKDPAWLARQARDLGRRAGLEVTVRDQRALEAEGFGGILAVGAGSARPPRLVELAYRPGGRRLPHVVLVGKGITFDSGGLSLKPREAMVPMKTDMAAGGAVIAAMAALRDAGVRARVTALVPAAENLPGGSALRPQDVVTHYGGRTVEVLNTDAEGRLVLADALAYADAHLDPDLLVDLATLTGAASLGLGRRHAALYSTDEELAVGLIAAGESSGERLWRMPLVEDYRSAMDSDVADLRNTSGDPHVSGGSITAALFLREFTGGRPWAHLDIAGPARADRDEHEVTRGGTGFGARLLVRWLEGLAGRPS
ncbi:MAG TPA: leucyl aminopeptidase [Actinomycetes bacterium]|nr:leucyl aminopeptidase [Actinomycetes bacterium]